MCRSPIARAEPVGLTRPPPVAGKRIRSPDHPGALPNRFHTSVALAAFTALGVMATPALAKSKSTSKLEFALNASGRAVPASWRGEGTSGDSNSGLPGNYYTKTATVYFTGATPRTIVQLKDDSTSGTVLGKGTANGSGNGAITLSEKTLDRIKGMGQILYLQNGHSASDQEGFDYGQNPPSTLPGRQTISIHIDAPAAGRLTIVWRGRINGTQYVMANGTKTTTGAGKTSVTMVLTSSGKTLLADGKAHPVTQDASFTAKGSASPGAGTTTTLEISTADELG